MNTYVKNASCSCSRCRSGRLLLPALIVTLGVLFLLDQNGAMEFDHSWPVLLLVTGLFLFLGSSASLEGHVQPYGAMPMAVPMAASPAEYPQPDAGPTQTAASGPTRTHNDPSHNDSQVNQ